jgi:hypothetical protein
MGGIPPDWTGRGDARDDDDAAMEYVRHIEPYGGEECPCAGCVAYAAGQEAKRQAELLDDARKLADG